MGRRLLDVNGRTVLITGAARGIGRAAAERLHARGANVALVGLEPERLAENAERLGPRAAAFHADVTDLDALQAAVAGAVERFGGVDVAIANAGIAFTGALATEAVDHVERTLAVNLLGVWRTDRAVIPELRRRRGHLLNIASLAAVYHAPLMGPYAAAKSGVEALSDSLRVELAPDGVSVGCAYFGFIDTDLVRASLGEPSAAEMNSRVPAFLRTPAPVGTAVDAIERGIERRSARVWTPRWIGPALAARGLLQPLIERLALADEQALREGIALAGSPEALEGEDPLLGVAAKVLGGEAQGAAAP